jgi:carbonic anhydrase
MRNLCGCGHGHAPACDGVGQRNGRRGLLGLGLACLAAASIGEARAANFPPTTLTADQALARLMAGNAAFVAGQVRQDSGQTARRIALAAGQAPFAAILACADSRSPPELLFEAGLGDIFTVRNAGNVADTGAIGSLEYAVAALGVPLVMVLGHEACGAAGAALAMAEKDERLPGRINEMVQPMLPAALAALRAGGDTLGRTVTENANRMAIRLVAESPVLGGAVQAGRLRVVTARYDLDEGRVALLG